MKRRSAIIEIICFLFIVLFVYASLTKLLEYERFKVQISQSPLLNPFAGLVAWMVPAVELMISGMLMFPRVRLFGLYAAFTLMVMFTGYIIAILNFSDYVPCSCGGVLEKLGWKEHLVFNIAFVILALAGIMLHSKQNDSETSETRRPQLIL
jgi:uncharacterized membrane protein YphA (DoxX/SURF4 family)